MGFTATETSEIASEVNHLNSDLAFELAPEQTLHLELCPHPIPEVFNLSQNWPEQELDTRSIYVGNVDYTASPLELESIFSKVGPVEKVTILVNQAGFPKGYAFVAFEKQDNVQRAIEEITGTNLRGRPLMVHQKLPLGKEMSKGTGGSGRGSGKGRGRGRGRGRGGARGGGGRR